MSTPIFLLLTACPKRQAAAREGVEEFDEKLWIVSVDKVVVIDDERLAFHFKSGTVIEA